ncbi:MAG: tetratricopeptide repeat protein [Deltaproteobacteria bacterium]|nr:tetratricopeptide repeat protein [Deltaproteobacteria bacterium]
MKTYNKPMKVVFKAIMVLASLSLVACGGSGPGGKSTTPKVDAEGKAVLSKQAKEDFQKMADKFKQADKAGWDAKTCDDMAEHFEEVASQHGMPDAAFNVGVVYDRCGKTDKAREAFQKAVSKFGAHVPTKQRSIAYLAYLDIKAGNIAASEQKLKECVGLGRNTMEAVPCYTIAATILRNRASEGDKESWAKAQKSLRTALAIDAKYMPALYQLARLYYSIAVSLKKDSYLTLATLVVDQAKKTDPEFAPIYLVLGQILLQKNELVEALKAFERAFEKDPNFFEAYMSFGAINLSFRGYEDAKRAFEKAVALQPKSYDAHMGLGVAARGLGDYALARSEYKKASEIDKSRTDYIFNLGVLEMDYENQGSVDEYKKAAAVFEKFIKHATDFHKKDPDGKGPELSWVDKAQKRIDNANKAVVQIQEAEKAMEEMKKLQEEQAKREKEMAELAKQAEELAKKEAEGEQAKTEEVDEAAIEKELAAEEAQKKEEAKAEEEAKKAEEKAQKAADDAKKDESKDKEGVEL